MELKVELLGADRLIARLGKASDILDPEMVEGLIEVADSVVQDARAIVRIDTGSLQKSIRRQHHVSQAQIHSIAVTAGGYITNSKTGRIVDYGHHLEYGTSRMPAHPFMRPALETNRPFLREVLKGKLRMSMQ